MLEVFYAAESHDTLALGSTSAERLDRFVARVDVGIKGSLSFGLFGLWRTTCRVWGEYHGRCGSRGI